MTTCDHTESTCRFCGLPIKDVGIDFWLHDADVYVDHEAVPTDEHAYGRHFRDDAERVS